MHIVMIVIGLVVLGIALDSVRRMRSANRDSLNMGQVVRKDLGELDPLDELRSELPHGGARRVNGAEVRQPERPPKSAAFLAKQGAVAPPPPNEKRAKVEPVLGTAPSLEDTIKTRRVPVMPKPALGDTQKTANQKITPPLEPRKPPVAAATPPSKEVDLDQEVPMLMDADDQATFSDERDMFMSGSAPVLSKPRVVSRKTPEASAGEPNAEQEVIVINVMARTPEGLGGAQLLEKVLAQGMRFGEMNIFHHYVSSSDNTILFSMANIVKPGTFDLNNMQSFQTPGVSFFMTLPLRAGDDVSSMDVFDRMFNTAKQLAQQLNGELRDERRSVMTGQTVEHCRHRISEFTRKKLSRSGKFTPN